jgi:hypothetical protein
VLSYSLKIGSGIPKVSAKNDSGLMLMDSLGGNLNLMAREGDVDFLADGSSLGHIGRATILDSGSLSFIAKYLPTSGEPIDALFAYGWITGRQQPLQNQPAGGVSAGELYGSFIGVGRFGRGSLLRATLKKSTSSTNEGIWSGGNTLLLRKGDVITENVKITRILRVWGISGAIPEDVFVDPQLVAHVQLSNRSQALLLRQSNGVLSPLIITGQPAPGIGLNKVTFASFQAIDVDPINGHYAILGSLKGVASTANQALWSGQTTLGNNNTQQYLRLPQIRLQKGELYHTAITNGDMIRSITLKPVVDGSGVGARGMAQVINRMGEILLTITGDRKVNELVKLTP